LMKHQVLNSHKSFYAERRFRELYLITSSDISSKRVKIIWWTWLGMHFNS